MRFKLRYIFIFLVFIAYSLDWGRAQILMMLIYALLVIRDDFKNFQLTRFDISTAFVALLILTNISHGIALFALSDNPYFFANKYSPEMANKAIFIFNFGGIIIMESMRSILRTRLKQDDSMLAITVKRFSFGYIFIFSALLFSLSANFKSEIISLGSFGTFILMLINGSVLLLSFIANSRNKHVWPVIIYTLFLSTWALQHSYLRMEILIPVVAYLGGDLLANRSIRHLHVLSKALIIGSIIIFPPLFTFLGESRAIIKGAERIDASLALFENDESNMAGQSVMSRMSVIPQLSNIIKLTEKNGYYNGSTLSYLGYVFIPRFIWPDKPLIMQGQWFALEIGAAYKKSDGRANNSVNMTVPGEFYLNYGWRGVIIGCMLFGFFVGWIWTLTSYNTIFGWAFRFYFIFLGLFSLGADLQIVPTLIAYLLLYRFLIFINSKLISHSYEFRMLK